MKLDVTTELKSVVGVPLLEQDEKGEAKSVLLRNVLINSLLIPMDSDDGVTKAAKWNLALKIQENDKVEVTPEQVVMMKNAVAKPYGPAIVGPVFSLLDNN